MQKRSIHIVRSKQGHKNTRLSFSDYFADVLTDPKSGIGHWIVQRVGSAEIVQWGQEVSFEEAEKCAKKFLEDLMRESLRMLEA